MRACYHPAASLQLAEAMVKGEAALACLGCFKKGPIRCSISKISPFFITWFAERKIVPGPRAGSLSGAVGGVGGLPVRDQSVRNWTGDHDGGQQGCGYSLRCLQWRLLSSHDPPGNDANMLALGARVAMIEGPDWRWGGHPVWLWWPIGAVRIQPLGRKGGPRAAVAES